MKRGTCMMIQGTLSAVGAFLSAKLGILFPVLLILAGMMFVDYISGMMASKVEAIEHPDDKNYGWSSKKGAIGIAKKAGYLAIIAVAMALDWLVLHVATVIGVTVTAKALFSLLVAVWYILNELLSIIENAGRMGVNVPDWLCKYIAALKRKIDDRDYEDGTGQ